MSKKTPSTPAKAFKRSAARAPSTARKSEGIVVSTLSTLLWIIRIAIFGLATAIFAPIIYNQYLLLSSPRVDVSTDAHFASAARSDAARTELRTSPNLKHMTIPLEGGLPCFVTTAGDPFNRAVVLIHGYPESGLTSWRHQIPFLSQRGYFVIAPDLRGFNGSATDAPDSVHTMQMAAKDIELLVAQLVAPGHRYAVVSHDWGVSVAWTLALQNQASVSSLMVIDGVHPQAYLNHAMRDPMDVLWHSWYIVWDNTLGLFGIAEWLAERNDWDWMVKHWMRRSKAGTFSVRDMEEYKAMWARPYVNTKTLAWYRSIPASITKRPAAVPDPATGLLPGYMSKEVPVVSLWGEEDPYLSVNVGKAAEEFAPNFSFTAFEGASHWLQHERPDEVNEEILKMLEDGRW
ncbi:hypothetical protein HK101_002123 [Irineochytrium annulatum]|nr:hypothetical protein HK101_002123 [Irineochytrium annulatum]